MNIKCKMQINILKTTVSNYTCVDQKNHDSHEFMITENLGW